jgi:DNA-binding NarL/FixJ family response regulator
MFHDVKPSNGALRVLLVDDHSFFGEGLRGMVEADGMIVVGEASEGAEAIALARSEAPDVAVIDLNMPGVGGMRAVSQILAANPQTQVVVLSASADRDDALQALRAGASSYLRKDMSLDDLAGAIRQAAGGNAVISREVVGPLLADLKTSEQAAIERPDAEKLGLTTRELEVLRLMVEGADNAEIGRVLSISRHTVKQYTTNVFTKLEVSNRVQAAVHAVRSGLV